VAIRIQTILIDDLDGSTDNVTTRRFGLDDLSYEIELSPTNLERLHRALDPFIAAGRRLPKTSRAKASQSKTGQARTGQAKASRSTRAGTTARPNITDTAARTEAAH
jgi:hypothetical protein